MGSDVIGDQARRAAAELEPQHLDGGRQGGDRHHDEHGRSNLARFDAQTGAREPLTTGITPSWPIPQRPTAAGSFLTMGDATHLADLYALDAQTKRLTQLTHVNDSLLASSSS